MTKGERISRFVEELAGAMDRDASGAIDPHATRPNAAEPARPRGEVADSDNIANHPCYRGFFRCWNEQRYYEAHDVLEHLWLKTESEDSDYFKGLIQAAGAFVHLQKHFEFPTHRVHGKRLAPAVRLFRLAEKNLTPFAPMRHSFDVAGLLKLLRETAAAITDSSLTCNPWSPDKAPRLTLGERSLA